MRNYLLSIMVVVGVSLASTGNTNERIKIFGIDLSENVKEAVAQLETIGLYCNLEFIGSPYRHIICADVTEGHNNSVDVAMLSLHNKKDEVRGLTLSCIVFSFCEWWGPWSLSQELKSSGVVHSWTTSLVRETSSYSQSVQQKKEYAFQRDEVTVRNTVTMTYGIYCDASGGVSLCIYEKADHSFFVKAAKAGTNSAIFDGPVLSLENTGEYKVDFNPKHWKESGLF